jgi:hypothetical protein
MPQVINPSANVTSGSAIAFSEYSSHEALDVVETNTKREHSERGTADNDYNENTITTDRAAVTNYVINFTMNNGKPKQTWYFADETDRDDELPLIAAQLNA